MRGCIKVAPTRGVFVGSSTYDLTERSFLEFTFSPELHVPCRQETNASTHKIRSRPLMHPVRRRTLPDSVWNTASTAISRRSEPLLQRPSPHPALSAGPQSAGDPVFRRTAGVLSQSGCKLPSTRNDREERGRKDPQQQVFLVIYFTAIRGNFSSRHMRDSPLYRLFPTDRACHRIHLIA